MLEKFNEFCTDFNTSHRENKYLAKVSNFFTTLKEAEDAETFRASDTYKDFLSFAQNAANTSDIELDNEMLYTHIMLLHIVTIDTQEKRALAFDILLEMHKNMMPNSCQIGDDDWKVLFTRESRGTNNLPSLTPHAIILFSGREDIAKLIKENKLDTIPSFNELITPDQTPKIQANNRLAIEYYLKSPEFTAENLISMITYPNLHGLIKDKYHIMAEQNPETAVMICEYILHNADMHETLLPYFCKIVQVIHNNNKENYQIIATQNPNLAKIICEYIIIKKEQYNELLPYFFQLTKAMHQNNNPLGEKLIIKLENNNKFTYLLYHSLPEQKYNIFEKATIADIVLHNKHENTTISRRFVPTADWFPSADQRAQPKYNLIIAIKALESIIPNNFRFIGVNALPLDIQPIFDFLKTNNSIRTLSLSNSDCRNQNITGLIEFLKANTSLEKLYLHIRITSKQVKEIVLAMEDNLKLTTLSIENYAIGGKAVTQLARFLKNKNSSLTVLNLRLNKIGEKGIKGLVNILKTHSGLQSLSISLGKIGEYSLAKPIAKALQNNNSSLKSLTIHGAIGDEGAKALAKVLETNSSIKDLVLMCDNITVDGAKALAEALKINSSLETLLLFGERITNEGRKELIESLKINYSLTTLTLDSGDEYNVEDIINAVLSNNKRTQSLRMRNILLEDEQAIINQYYSNHSRNQTYNSTPFKNFYSLAKSIVRVNEQSGGIPKVYGKFLATERFTVLLAEKFNQRTDLYAKLDMLENNNEEKRKFASKMIQALSTLELGETSKFYNLGYQKAGLHTIVELMECLCSMDIQDLQDWWNSNEYIHIQDTDRFLEILNSIAKPEEGPNRRTHLDRIIDSLFEQNAERSI